MGIRVHKCLGYGLTDLQTGEKNWDLTDTRINPKGIIRDDWKNKEYTAVNYLTWVNEQNEQREWLHRNTVEPIFLKDKDLTTWEWEPRRAFVLQLEYGLPILCIRPLWQQQWARSDETIDWVEETYCNGDDSQHNWFKVLPDGIFPYNGLYMHAETGEPFHGENAMQKVVMWKRLQNYERDHPEGQLTQEKRDSITQQLLNMNWADAERFVVPLVPEEIRDLCEWGNAFTDDEVWKQLRPMLYVYWA